MKDRIHSENSNKDSFIYKAHCEMDSPSSKRLYGGIGFVTCQICIIAATALSLKMTGELSPTIANLLDFDLVTSASLLGLATITRAFGGGKTIIENRDEIQQNINKTETGYKDE